MRLITLQKIGKMLSFFKSGKYESKNGYYSKEVLEDVYKKLGPEEFIRFTRSCVITTTPDGAMYVKEMGGEITRVMSRKMITRKVTIFFKNINPMEINDVYDWRYEDDVVIVKTLIQNHIVPKQNISSIQETKIILYKEINE